ncbi:kinase-like domain-containing protein [Pisolithus marmoratus]|nr:kinase-like domain-containing protein [Pisolithus marmoratus]
MDNLENLRETLRQFTKRASRYSIDLNGRVSRSTFAVPRGGHAIVYRGVLQPDGTSVAIKTPRGGLSNDEQTIQRVLREVHLWSKLKHENIVRVLGITTEFDSTMSIVSPWMEKRDARDYVQDKAIDPRPLMIDIAQGLQYLHTHQPGAVFHGDLKGCNVLISESGQALLTDFGFSHLVNSTFSMSTGTFGCSVYWTAPEIFLDDKKQLSAEADVWSFGMTLLELFTRENPFHPCNLRAILGKMHRNEIPDRPSNEKTCSRLTEPWWNVCLACWHSEPESRPTIQRVLKAIVNIYGPLCPTSYPDCDVVD